MKATIRPHKFLWLVIWAAFHLAIALWSSDLIQWNRETIFLSKSGNQSYDYFKSVVDERRVLAVKLELPSSSKMTEAYYQESRAFYDSLKEKYAGDEFAWMDFQDIYSRGIGALNFENILQFSDAQKSLLMPLLGQNHSGFLLMIDQKVEDTAIQRLIHDITAHRWQSPFKTYLGGLPYINMKLNEYAEDIKFTLIPLMVVISMLVTAWLLRNLKHAILLVIPSVFSLIQTLAIAKGLYGTLNMVTAVVPLMVFVINLMVSFHLFYALKLAGSFRSAWQIKKVPLILSVVTMGLGFLTNYISEIPVIKQFAVVSTISVVGSAVLTTLGIWVLEPWLGNFANDKHPRMFHQAYMESRWSKRTIAIVTAILIALAGIVAPRLELVTDATRYFPASSGLREAIKKVETDFLGTPSFEVLITNADQQALSFEQLRQIYDFENTIPGALGAKYKVLSLGQLLTEANMLFSGVASFPPQRITGTMLMGGMPAVVRGAFPLGEVYRISLMGTTMNSDEFRTDLATLTKTLGRLTNLGFKFELNGLNFHLMNAQESLVNVMLEGFGITLLMVTLLFAVTFRQWSTVGSFLLASLLPMASGVIAIFVFNFSINIATVMTFSIALGMIVDNSFHMTWNIQNGRRFSDYYADTIVPIIGSGVLLGLGFASFALNGFLPIRQVGVLVAVMLVVGIVCSLYVLAPIKR